MEIPFQGIGPHLKLPRFISNEKTFLSLVLAVFLIISSYKLDQIPGLYEDEALPGLKTKLILISENLSPEFLNMGPTTGPGSVFIPLLFFLIFDIGILPLRISTVFIATIALIFSYLFVKDLFGKGVAGISLLLQAFLPGFVILSRFGGWCHTYYALPVSMVLYLSLRWFRTKRASFLYLSSLMMGFGINQHIIFLYFLFALLFSVTILKVGLIRVRKRGILAFLLIFFISSAPYWSHQLELIINEIRNPLRNPWYNILNQILGYGLISRTGLNNLDFMNNLNTRIFQLNDFLSGGIDFDICNYTSRNALFPFQFILSTLFFFIVVIIKFKVSKELFITLLLSVIFLELCFSTSNLLETHFLLTFPLPFIIMAYPLYKVIKLFNPAFIIVLILIVLNLFAIVDYYSCLDRTGGNRYFSVELYNLVDYLENSNATRFVLLDWGLLNNLRFLSDDLRIQNLLEFRLDLLGYRFSEAALKNTFDNSTLFILSLNIYEPIFSTLVYPEGKSIYVEKLFYFKSGYWLYCIFRVY
jgi:4-amino-4-deoxy-L-arabinose transferase-like glycosyltransferase